MAKIRVYPTHVNALNVKHPIDGALKHGGSDWESDGFTARMLTDGSVTTNESEACRPAVSENVTSAIAQVDDSKSGDE
jgi:hypothetical protein